MAYLTWYGNKIEGDCFMTALDKDLAGIVSVIVLGVVNFDPIPYQLKSNSVLDVTILIN